MNKTTHPIARTARVVTGEKVFNLRTTSDGQAHLYGYVSVPAVGDVLCITSRFVKFCKHRRA